jgi:8-oxo-dGTP diphosphatase
MMNDGDMGPAIELIARGVLIGPRGILLCQSVGQDNTFLPGGHVEHGESATAALARELQEELGMRVKVEDFLGALEAVYTHEGRVHHEVNLVFGISSPTLVRRAKLTASESHINFSWQPINALTDANLLPKPLRALIPQWTRGKHAPWASDIRD